MSLHRFEDDEPTTWSRYGPKVVYAVCGLILLAVTAGMVWAVARGPVVEETATQLTVTPPSQSPAAGRREVVSPAETEAPNQLPVDPKCWETRPDAERTGCQKTVAERTKFVQRYRTNQTSLAAKHPAVKQAATGRSANSLARHGLLVCWLVHTPRYSLPDIRSAFYLWFHAHPFTVPNDDLDAAADSVISIAIQDVCPSEAEALERKGGPKAELVSP